MLRQASSLRATKFVAERLEKTDFFNRTDSEEIQITSSNSVD